ncbi:MAG: heme-binding beta-barrel domain-containing protein [Candidatus Dormibacteria bacterium]
MAATPSPEQLAAGIAPLLGEWQGEGQGQWVRATPFCYRETLSLRPVPGRALVRWSQATVDAETGELSHSEEGYLRLLPEARLELVLAIPAGYVEIHTGTWDGTGLELGLRALAASPSSRALSMVHRQLRLEGELLRHTVRIAVDSATPVPHVEALLRRLA